MIYYICILTTGQTMGSLAEYAKTAIQNHGSIGKMPPNPLNEPCAFVAITDKVGVKKLEFKDGDVVRLSVGGMKNSYFNSFNIQDFTHVKEIFDDLMERKVKVEPVVVYC